MACSLFEARRWVYPLPRGFNVQMCEKISTLKFFSIRYIIKNKTDAADQMIAYIRSNSVYEESPGSAGQDAS